MSMLNDEAIQDLALHIAEQNQDDPLDQLRARDMLIKDITDWSESYGEHEPAKQSACLDCAYLYFPMEDETSWFCFKTNSHIKDIQLGDCNIVTYKLRCCDCVCLVAGEQDEWLCDQYDKSCESIITCGDWETDSLFATLTHHEDGSVIL